MIDNFDRLVQRCALRRRRQMIRLSLMIVATILMVIASVSGYQMWLTSQKTADAVRTPSKAHIALNSPAVGPEPTESNTTRPSVELAPAEAPQKPLSPKKEAVSVRAEPEPAAAAQTVPNPSAPLRGGPLFDVSAPSQSASADPLETYQRRPGYDTALAIARDFYAKNNFSEAAVWAKKANQLNREGEEAWLLYAKSYYAQGRKNEAVGVLELYLNYKDSRTATELLRTWKTSGE
ncbi:MAG: tetratricopeptide repeat protein [Campylobacterales bacterium]|nr:tetratricopeptide repeat protein [Campylobacterales bacterium]